MTKDTIRQNWKPGDDSAAVRYLKDKHNIAVTRWALAAWRKSDKPSRTPLADKYIEAFKTIQKREK